MRKMRMVLKHPPPIFFAPYPAASPRSSLLMTCTPDGCVYRPESQEPYRGWPPAGSEGGGRRGRGSGRLVGARSGSARSATGRLYDARRFRRSGDGTTRALRFGRLRQAESERIHLAAIYQDLVMQV